MASSGERRMLFDTRGKRKHVIRVVYAILALLMGASLFLVVGPFNVANLIGGSSSSSAAKVLHEQAERIETRLARNPGDPQLLLALTRAQINAGNAQFEKTSETAAPTVTPEARKDLVAAGETWTRYLKKSGGEPNAPAAQLMASAYFSVAESSASIREAQEYVVKAAAAQRIAARQSPSLGTLSTLAIYEYFAGNFSGGEEATRQAAAKVNSKTEAKNVEKQLAEYRKRGKAFAKQKKEAAKYEREKGKEALENPLGGFGGGTSLGGG